MLIGQLTEQLITKSDYQIGQSLRRYLQIGEMHQNTSDLRVYGRWTDLSISSCFIYNKYGVKVVTHMATRCLSNVSFLKWGEVFLKLYLVCLCFINYPCIVDAANVFLFMPVVLRKFNCLCVERFPYLCSGVKHENVYASGALCLFTWLQAMRLRFWWLTNFYLAFGNAKLDVTYC